MILYLSPLLSLPLHDAVIFPPVHFMFSLYHHQHNSIIFPTHPPQSNPLLGDPVIIRGPSLESRDNQRARQAVPVYIKDPGLDSSASNMIKLSVNEAKWSSLLARTRTLILYISIWIFDFGPEKLKNRHLSYCTASIVIGPQYLVSLNLKYKQLHVPLLSILVDPWNETLSAKEESNLKNENV